MDDIAQLIGNALTWWISLLARIVFVTTTDIYASYKEIVRLTTLGFISYALS